MLLPSLLSVMALFSVPDPMVLLSNTVTSWPLITTVSTDVGTIPLAHVLASAQLPEFAEKT